MADELRWETLVVTGASANAAAEFRNDTNDNLFIRKIYEAHSMTDSNNDQGSDQELSKSPALAMVINNGVFFTLPSKMAVNGGDVNNLDFGRANFNGRTSYAKGELVLEPNESLFVNFAHNSSGGVFLVYTIGYHF